MVELRRLADERLPDRTASPEEIARVVNRVLDGQTQNVGQVTLLGGTTATTVRSEIFRATTVLVLVPLSSAAAAVSWWQSSLGRRSVTIGHADPGSDADFAWVAFG